jgi:glyoxalase family protein
MSETKSAGLHHVTAFAKDPQRNLDFYRQVLGLRLVKLTVNFDAPDVYHTYFGDDQGRPGTLITFFPFPHAARGRPGVGEVSETCYAAPAGSLGFWADRLTGFGLEARPDSRFGEERLVFEDGEGMRLAIVANGPEGGEERQGIGPRHALQRIASVTLSVDGYERTAALLTAVLGAEEMTSEGAIFRFRVGDTFADIECAPGRFGAAMGAGSVHHVAWRAADGAQQQAFRERLTQRGLNPTPVLDRSYFRSIYFREPGASFSRLRPTRRVSRRMRRSKSLGRVSPCPTGWSRSVNASPQPFRVSISMGRHRRPIWASSMPSSRAGRRMRPCSFCCTGRAGTSAT